MYEGRVLLITGGTGSFGNAVLNHFLKTDIQEIRVFSRDEKKQDDMRRVCNDARVKYYIGDVRDMSSVTSAVYGVDYVFHAAALKQVPSCEFFPLEAVKTNVLGTENVLSAAVSSGVRKCVCLSTDKAAYPINAMGISKAMMEKIVVAKSRTADPQRTMMCITRYGNVLASRGSVVPLFVQQIKSNLPLTITNPAMTRYVMSLQEAVGLVTYAFENCESGDIIVQKSAASTVGDLAEAVRQLFAPNHPIRIIGTRHGEKMYETLLTGEESFNAQDLGNYYRVPADNRDLNYDKYFIEGSPELSHVDEHNSHNARRLNVDQVKEKLLSLSFIQDQLTDWVTVK